MPNLVSKKSIPILDPTPQRSRIMKAIKSHGNQTTELALIRIMRASKIVGWRRRVELPGHPDFTFARERLTVFVDGCFWHGCERCYRAPSTNSAFWSKKILLNEKRDRRVDRALRHLGWSVMRIWEHSIRETPVAVVRRLRGRMLKRSRRKS
jgi:DNA mismatch endonuclease (patch repair protein)